MSYQKLSIYQNGVLVDGDLTFDANNQAVITVKYESDDSTTTGVGFALNFDSSVLGSPVVSDVDSNAMAAGVLNDAGDGLEFGFVSLFGQFPGSNEADLATITFNNVGGSASAPMPSMTFTSTAAGFEGQIGNPEPAEPLAPLEITTFDIDENSGAGQVLATVDNAVEGETFSFAGPSDSSVIVVPEQQAGTQHVYVSESTKSEDGTQVTVVLSYKADAANTTGVGFTLGFDSSVLTLNNVSDVFSGAIATGNLNPEGNGLGFGWASLFGQFPGSEEAVLATITFDIADGASGSTGLDISVESAAAGFAFDGQPHDVVISAEAGDPNISIDSATGTVTLDIDPNFEDVSEYSFDIVSSASRTASGTSQIIDVAPVITSGDTAAAIDENTGAGQVIYTATSNEDATYSLSGADADKFDIDAATGAVTLLDNADADTQSQYSFEVSATDAGGNASAAQSVTLDITNLDEVAPTITSGGTADSIDENSGAGQLVYTAAADDSADVSGGVSFSLAGDDADAFEIDAVSGAVTLLADPNYEGQSSYTFDVVATDAAGNASAPQSVSLDINNLDEVAPTITSGGTATSVVENSDAGQLVYTATADDSADVSNGEITFSLAGADADAFTIDASSGEVTLDVSPDYETKTQYSFEVTATDAAG